jgi:hypothetical protein
MVTIVMPDDNRSVTSDDSGSTVVNSPLSKTDSLSIKAQSSYEVTSLYTKDFDTPSLCSRRTVIINKARSAGSALQRLSASFRSQCVRKTHDFCYEVRDMTRLALRCVGDIIYACFSSPGALSMFIKIARIFIIALLSLVELLFALLFVEAAIEVGSLFPYPFHNSYLYIRSTAWIRCFCARRSSKGLSQHQNIHCLSS